MTDKKTEGGVDSPMGANPRDNRRARDDNPRSEVASSPALTRAGAGDGKAATGPEEMPTSSLAGYYSARSSKAAALVKTVRLGAGGGFPDTDRQTILADISRLDPYLSKSLALAQAVTDPTKDRAVLDWIGQLVHHELSGHWVPEAGTSAAEMLDEMSRVIRAQMQQKEARKKGFNLLFMTLAWLAPRGLQPEDALRAIEHALAGPKRGSITSDERQRQAIAELAKLKASPKLLEALLRILDPWRTRTREAEAESAVHCEEVSALNSSIEALEQNLSEYRERTNNLEVRLADQRGQLEDQERRLSAQHNLAQSQLALTRGTINGWLENEVRPRLADALDAADCDPPRHEVFRERLKALLGLLDQKKGRQWG